MKFINVIKKAIFAFSFLLISNSLFAAICPSVQTVQEAFNQNKHTVSDGGLTYSISTYEPSSKYTVLGFRDVVLSSAMIGLYCNYKTSKVNPYDPDFVSLAIFTNNAKAIGSQWIEDQSHSKICSGNPSNCVFDVK